jgi:hypothetical protein
MDKLLYHGKFITPEEYEKLEGLVSNETILENIDTALKYFDSQQVKPTLRTLFYHLYSKQIIPNTEDSYTKLSGLLVKARKLGRFAWDILEDKTRKSLGRIDNQQLDYGLVDSLRRDYNEKIENLDIDRIINSYINAPTYSSWNFGKWAEQPTIPEIWIEKEALASTIESWVSDIEIRICRGYPSWTFLHNAIEDIKTILTGGYYWNGNKCSSHKKVVILYLGDLDPSGLDIERHIKSAFQFFKVENVEFKRLAITEEQVKKYNLPPRPKDAETLEKLEKDPRSKKYQGKCIIELDALVAYAPQEFKDLITNAVNSLYDVTISTKLDEESTKLREESMALYEQKQQEAKKKLLEQLTQQNQT